MNKPIIIQGALQSEIDYLLKNFQIKNKRKALICQYSSVGRATDS